MRISEKKIEEAKLTSPAIIVVGDVVSLNDRLDFFEKKTAVWKKKSQYRISKQTN